MKTPIILLFPDFITSLSYSLYNGSQYEGYTLIPMIDDFKQRFSLGKDFIVVADSGLMNNTNVDLLRQAGYKIHKQDS